MAAETRIKEEELTKNLTNVCQQMIATLWKDPEETKRKDEQLEQRLAGFESLIRKRTEHTHAHEEKLKAVVDSGKEFRLSIQKQVSQLDDAINFPQMRESILEHEKQITNLNNSFLKSSILSDHLTQNDAKTLKERVNQMLKTIPDGCSDDHRTLWRKLRPLTVEQLEKCWNLVDPNNSLFINVNLEFQKWKSGGITNYGMRDRKTGLPFGIVRQVKPNGWIHESTFKDGKLHGLSR